MSNNENDLLEISQHAAIILLNSFSRKDTMFFTFVNDVPNIIDDLTYDLFVTMLTYQGPLFTINNIPPIYVPINEIDFSDYMIKICDYLKKYFDYIETIL